MKHNNRSETTETETLAVTQTYSSSTRPLSALVSSSSHTAAPLGLGDVFPVLAQSSLTAPAQFSHRNGKVLPPQRENFAGAVKELCH